MLKFLHFNQICLLSLENQKYLLHMNQEFDCNQLFAQLFASCQNLPHINEKASNQLNLSSSAYTGQQDEESIHNYFSLEVQQPQQINHIWFQNHQIPMLDKISYASRKDTADAVEIQSQEIVTLKGKRRRSHETQKNQTKNIPKNFGKAILAFIQTHKKTTKSVLQKLKAGSYRDLVDFLTQHKKQITTIADLRSLWLDHPYEQVLRTLSCNFLRKHSLEYIFNSRICNYGSHIKYRQRFLEAIKAPGQFQHIKQY